MGRPHDALLGRQQETEVLEAALVDACNGEPGFVVVSGQAGIGKTRLLAQLAKLAIGRGCLTLNGRSEELNRQIPFAPFVDALDAYLDSRDPVVLDRLAVDRLGVLAAAFPSLQSLRESVDHPGSALERFRIYQAVKELLERLAGTRPLLLILDDLQWADEGSLELLAYLLRHPPQAEVLIAVAIRPGHAPADAAHILQGIEHTPTALLIELGPLTARDIGELVVGAQPVDTDELHRLSGGNPFYALQLARIDFSTATGIGVDDLGVPPAVGRSIASELEALSPEIRTVAEVAAVIGDPFEVDLLMAAMKRDEIQVFDYIDELVVRDLIHETEIPRRFEFRHPIVRSAVYGSLTPGTRVKLHRRVAESLRARGSSATIMAGHVEQSAQFGDKEAVRVLHTAGREAADRAPASAQRWFSAALRLLPPTASIEERVELLGSLASSRAAMGHLAEARSALEECIVVSDANGQGSPIDLIVRCAELEQLLGRHSDARARLESAYRDLPDPRSTRAVSLLIALAAASLYLADHTGMLDWGRLALDAAEELGDETMLAAALAANATGAAFAGEIQLGMNLCDRAARLADSMTDADITDRLDILSNLVTAEMYLDRHVRGCAHGERALALARATGQTHLLPILTPILGTSLALAGEMNRSVEVLEDAIEAARLVGNAQALSLNLFNRCLCAVLAGDLDTALAAGAESVELARSVDNGVITAFAGAIHAQALLESGEAQAALELLVDSVGGEGIPLLAGSWRAHFLEVLARCNLQLDRRASAHTAAQRTRELADGLGLDLPGLLADRAESAVMLAEGQAGHAVELARSAVERAERIQVPLYAASARAQTGTALVVSGRAAEAVELLERAAADFEDLGAIRYRNQVESELRRLGRTIHRRTRPGNPDARGVEALTGRELEVAEMVVDRRTNREIAQALFLSTKTIETHMRNIFNKLGVNSRVEVARVLASDPALRPDPELAAEGHA